MAKRKSLKLGKRKSRATTSGKVYLNGNSYACLSGLYFTSLNNETAIEEWSKIPFINRPLYGMEFKGFSTNPNDDGNGEDFISIGDLFCEKHSLSNNSLYAFLLSIPFIFAYNPTE